MSKQIAAKSLSLKNREKRREQNESDNTVDIERTNRVRAIQYKQRRRTVTSSDFRYVRCERRRKQ